MLIYDNVNDAFRSVVDGINQGDWETFHTRREMTRYGEVLRLKYPITWRYNRPYYRVLFNKARDANPFFHFYEAMWMLAGRRDVQSVAHYCSRMAEFSDDGEVIHDAYGYRWRQWFGLDQLDYIVRILQDDPKTRRCVLSMWAFPDLMRLKDHPRCKALPCNTHAYIDITHGALNLTICNRSNDLVWGAFGANAVHFSFLQEYLAARVGCAVGHMTTFSSNLHVYTARWKPDKWLSEEPVNPSYPVPLCLPDERDTLRTDVEHFAAYRYPRVQNRYLNDTGIPMMRAFEAHKRRDYDEADVLASGILCPHWKYACRHWIEKRRRLWEHDDK